MMTHSPPGYLQVEKSLSMLKDWLADLEQMPICYHAFASKPSIFGSHSADCSSRPTMNMSRSVLEFYVLPPAQAMLASPDVVYRKFFAGSCSSTRVAPEPTYSPFIDGIGCVPAGAVGVATILLFSPDNSLSYV
jgi:hypothetical protein